MRIAVVDDVPADREEAGGGYRQLGAGAGPAS